MIKIKALVGDKFDHDKVSFAIYATCEQEVKIGFSFGTDHFKEIIAHQQMDPAERKKKNEEEALGQVSAEQ